MILIAIEQEGYVYVYNDNKQQIIKVKGSLYSYNTEYVAINIGSSSSIIDIYNVYGAKVCTYPRDLIDTSNIQGTII